MEFGRVTNTELSRVDFSLPAEPDNNKAFFNRDKKLSCKTNIYFGCPRWGTKEWVGTIYPKGTKEGKFLDYYVSQYGAVELNATHYKIYTPTEIERWAAKAVGRQFKFCPKVPQVISHYSGFKNAEQLTTAFLEGIMAFGSHLGPVFLQLSDKYSPAHRDVLYKYMQSLPTDVEFFLEVRHPDWFADKAVTNELLQVLTTLNIGFVITDTAGRRDCAHMHLTVPKAFIRYVGNSLHESDYRRADEWINRMKYWVNNGMEEIYFFMHMHNEATSPELIRYMVDNLNTVCGLHLIKPKLETSGLLF
jgi:uncharacterized protein YecE (DUF72 family)